MTEDFVTYELAVKLKEKGFDEPCDMYYHIYDDIDDCVGSLESTGFGISCFYNSNNKYRCAAPTISQVLKWLREEKKVYVLITPYPSMAAKNKIVWAWGINWNSDGVDIRTFSDDDTYISYEEAALAGITWVLDNII